MKKNKHPDDIAYWVNLTHERIINSLKDRLPSEAQQPQTLHRALHYVMSTGGKRLRPMLVYQTNQMLGGDLKDADNAALAVELIHTYSLVHDDLPAMDDDDLRRGKPSCHIAFDEATAILVGDSLQALAFEVLSEGASSIEASHQLKMVNLLSAASGLQGMCGGQALDIEAIHTDMTGLKRLHEMKTGALIKASIMLGAYSSGKACPENLSPLKQFADCIGLAFQVKDDVLDIIGTTEDLGKPQGSDQMQGKVTYPSLMGLEASKLFAKELCHKGKDYLQKLDFNVSPLSRLADYINERVV